MVRTHTTSRIVITGNQSELITSNGSADVSEDVPAKLISKGDHAAIVEWWHAEAARWEREAIALRGQLEAEANMLEVEEKQVNARGFTSAIQFESFVERAKAHQLRTNPAGRAGVVMVQSGSSPANYAVTRTSCDCYGHQHYGRCYHRALVIWLHDVQGVPVCRVPTIGFSPRGVSLTIGRKPAARKAVA